MQKRIFTVNNQSKIDDNYMYVIYNIINHSKIDDYYMHVIYNVINHSKSDIKYNEIKSFIDRYNKCSNRLCDSAYLKEEIFEIDADSIDWNAYRDKLFSTVSWDNLEIGEPVYAETIINDLLNVASREAVAKWISDMVVNNTGNPLLLCTILHAISHMDYGLLQPFSALIIMAMFSNNDNRVAEYAVKAVSNWNSKESLNYLKNNAPKQEWLKNEWRDVVNYIERYGD